MSNKSKALAVVIARTQIATNAHFYLFHEAGKLADNVLILVGSANRSPSERNPFSFQFRQKMIRAGLEGSTLLMRSAIKPINDHLYIESDWESGVQSAVHEHAKRLKINDRDITIVGHEKDDTYYIDSFPEWGTPTKVDAYQHHSGQEISATLVRNKMLAGESIRDYVPRGVADLLENDYMKDTEASFGYDWLRNHCEGVRRFKETYKDLPYGINHVTGDALVICRGHIALIQRAEFDEAGNPNIGANQWALPGGFKEVGEYSRDCILRELKEETTIDVPDRSLRQAYKGSQMFEGATRDDRGDFTTHCGMFILESNLDGSLPKLTAKSDAKKAQWFSFAKFSRMSRFMFADHYYIIEAMRKTSYGTGFTG